jgi:hypothetical protein
LHPEQLSFPEFGCYPRGTITHPTKRELLLVAQLRVTTDKIQNSGEMMSRFILQSFVAGVLVAGVASAQQPSGTSPAPAPGTHMDQSTTQTVGTQNSTAAPPVTPAASAPDTRATQPPAAPVGAPGTAAAPASPSPAAPAVATGTPVPAETSSTNTSASPPEPVTKILSGGGGTTDPNDLGDLLSPKPLPGSKLSLVGGTVKSIDQIRDHMTLKIYGSGTMKVKFDQRTHFFRDGRETTQLAVKKGDRVYLDTQLNQGAVFAKNVHIGSTINPADASGQIVSFDSRSGDMLVRDELSGSPVKFRLAQSAAIKNGSTTGSRSDLRPGALVAVKFSPTSQGRGLADEVAIIAEPGTSFTYFGRVTHLDLRSGLLALENQADGKIYDLHFERSTIHLPTDLSVGSQVTVMATFTGRTYDARSIEVNAGPAQARVSDAENLPAAGLNSSDGDFTKSNDKKKKDRKSKDKKDKNDSSASNDDSDH